MQELAAIALGITQGGIDELTRRELALQLLDDVANLGALLVDRLRGLGLDELARAVDLYERLAAGLLSLPGHGALLG